MRFFKIILFSIIINVPFSTSEKETTFEEKNCEDIYVSRSFSEEKAISILTIINKNLDNFDYITPTHCNNRYSFFDVTLDNENVLNAFCTLLLETTKITVKDTETAENNAIELITFVMDEYTKKLINTLKSSEKNELSLILDINEVAPSIIILCNSPTVLFIKQDLIEAYSDFMKLQSSKYKDISETYPTTELRNNLINIMISQFISNVACASLLLFPQKDFDNQYYKHICILNPTTKNSELIKDKK